MGSAEDSGDARSAGDAFWERMIAEAEAAGGSVEVDVAAIPPVPGVAACLPSGRVGAGKHLALELDAGRARLTVSPDLSAMYCIGEIAADGDGTSGQRATAGGSLP